MAIAAVSLFFRGNRQYGVGNIKFDLELEESHNFTSRVSVHNVEDGSVISDHIQNDLENGTLTGLVSNYSLNTYTLSSNRAQDVFDAFVALWEERTLVEIVTVLKVYTDVAVTSIPISKDSEDGESVTVQVSFQKVKVVKLQEVQLDLSIKVADLASNQNRQVAGKQDAGRNVTSLI
jgi:hypothetical protein